MSRFLAPDLATLPKPDAIEALDFEGLAATRKATLLALLAAWPEQQAEVAVTLALESEPLVKDVEVGAYRELVVRGRINDAVRALLFPTSKGADLDNLFSWLTGRLSDAATGWVESDAEYKVRIQLALEAFSVAGSEGAYLFYAMSTGQDGRVKDAACYGPHNTREATPGTPESAVNLGVPNGHVHLVVLASAADGTASQSLLDQVAAECGPKQRRPLGDWLHVMAATIEPYAISYRLRVGAGADAGLIEAEARRRLAAYAAKQHRVGAVVAPAALDAAASISGSDGLPLVEQAIRVSPASWVDAGAYGAPWCTNVSIVVETVDD